MSNLSPSYMEGGMPAGEEKLVGRVAKGNVQSLVGYDTTRSHNFYYYTQRNLFPPSSGCYTDK